ncbi:hypothetical protein AOC36_09570 [Erysipelothrix larvae]|uniref:Portal protein n=1 Tax=Erysipelothrix larvae TaxID=1514105 RepID=A0A0X8H1B8_9FIRM|nr:phage portal protein [Erysipelothrix larvae]AMC94221.1 hypothetical protein AOC36_09570 [Erysipelothrix larvae]
MGFFDFLFKPKEKDLQAVSMGQLLKMLNFESPYFFNRKHSSVYESDLIRSAIHAKAKHTAKLKPLIIGDINKELGLILSTKPNPFQSTYDFLYRLRTLYETDTCVFILPLYRDVEQTVINGLYPLKASMSEIVEYEGALYLRYTFANGQKAAIEYDRVGVIMKMNYASELFGDTNQALDSTLNLIDMQNQAINQSIKSSAAIRFIAALSQPLHEDDLKKERENFSMKNLSAENDTGVMIIDGKYKDVKQLESKQFVIETAQMEYIKNSIFSYFGVNQKILQNDFDENVWNSFYEGEIETFAIQCSLAINNMIFTLSDIKKGSNLYFQSNRLQYASNKTKYEVTSGLFDRGIYGVDDVAEAWGLPITGNNKKYIRKEYAEIGEDGAIKYDRKESEVTK